MISNSCVKRWRLQQAERERGASEAHARLMERQQAELAQALARQQALQEELIEARKLAGLGQLLVTLAQRLDGPLHEAEALLAGAQPGLEALRGAIAEGAPVGRRQLQELAQASAQCCGQAQALVEHGIADIEAYRGLRHED